MITRSSFSSSEIGPGFPFIKGLGHYGSKSLKRACARACEGSERYRRPCGPRPIGCAGGALSGGGTSRRGGSHRVGNAVSPSLFPHQRSERHRTSRTSAAFPPEPLSCAGIAPLGKRSRMVGFGIYSGSEMPLRPVSPGCSDSRSAPATPDVDFGLNQTTLYSRIDTEGVIFYN